MITTVNPAVEALLANEAFLIAVVQPISAREVQRRIKTPLTTTLEAVKQYRAKHGEIVPVEPAEIIPYDAEQSRAADDKIRMGIGMTRIDVFLFWKHRGWEGLKFASFDEWMADRLDTARSTVYEWIAQVETTMDARGMTMADLTTMWSNEKAILLPMTITRKLHKLTTAEERRRAYDTYEDIRQGEARSDEKASTEVGRIVQQHQRDNRPATSPEQSPSRNGHAPVPTLPAPEASALTLDMDAGEERLAPAKPEQVPPVNAAFPTNFPEWKIALETALTWVESEIIDGAPRVIIDTMSALTEVAAWIESELMK